jgi:hypothetical protein
MKGGGPKGRKSSDYPSAAGALQLGTRGSSGRLAGERDPSWRQGTVFNL